MNKVMASRSGDQIAQPQASICYAKPRCVSLASPIHAPQTPPGLYQPPARHPLVRQRKQRDELCRVLRQASIANLREPELLLNHSERMLDLGPDAGLQLLHSLGIEPGSMNRFSLLRLPGRIATS